VAFGVASYTVHRADDSQRREAMRTYRANLYLPFSSAVAGLVACTAPDVCTNNELAIADREYRRISLIVVALGSDEVRHADDALFKVLYTAVRNQALGKKQPKGLSAVSKRAITLQQRISKELMK